MNKKTRSKQVKVAVVSIIGIFVLLLLLDQYAVKNRLDDFKQSENISENPTPVFERLSTIKKPSANLADNVPIDGFTTPPLLLENGEILLCSDDGWIFFLDA